MSLQAEIEKTLEAHIGKIHQQFANSFPFLGETRDLDAKENALLLELDRNSTKYRQLAGILAVESFANYVISLLTSCQPLLEITAIIFENLKQAKNIASHSDDHELRTNIHQSWLNLSKLAEVTHRLFPNSALIKVHREFIQGQGYDPSQAIYTRLYDENIELKSKIEQNDRQLLELQLKLTELLQEHDGYEDNTDSTFKMLELRQKLKSKQSEIEHMNEEFSFEIEKYNTVYEVMKREIQELQQYQEFDLYQMVERLQTEIVKLRQEKQRDQAVIQELRERLPYAGSSMMRKPTTTSRVYY